MFGPEPANPVLRRIRDRQIRQLAKAFAGELGIVLAPMVQEYAQPLVTPVAGRVGWQELINGTAPAPGSGTFSYQVPGEEVVRLLSVSCRVTTSATVASRSVALEYRDDQGIPYALAGAPVSITAGQSHRFYWYETASTPSWPIDAQSSETAVTMPLPGQFVYPVCSIVIKLANVQAGDQIDQVRLSAEKFSTEPL